MRLGLLLSGLVVLQSLRYLSHLLRLERVRLLVTKLESLARAVCVWLAESVPSPAGEVVPVVVFHQKQEEEDHLAPPVCVSSVHLEAVSRVSVLPPMSQIHKRLVVVSIEAYTNSVK